MRDHFNQIPLILALKISLLAITKLLIEKNVNLKMQTQSGKTALMTDSINRDFKVVRFLLALGASFYVKSGNADNALLCSAYSG